MHSLQPSRRRILFEVFCAFAMVASMVGAWRQTNASALLVAATVAALYGFVRLFDMPGKKAAPIAEPQRIDFENEDRQAVSGAVVMIAAARKPSSAGEVVEEAVEEKAAVEATTPRPGSGRRTGGSRKSGGRRAKAPKAGKAVAAGPGEEVMAPWPMAEEAVVPEVTEPAFEDEEFVFEHDEQSSQPHIQPLFEPEPFVRMPRQGFGRRGRL